MGLHIITVMIANASPSFPVFLRKKGTTKTMQPIRNPIPGTIAAIRATIPAAVSEMCPQFEVKIEARIKIAGPASIQAKPMPASLFFFVAESSDISGGTSCTVASEFSMVSVRPARRGG